MGFGMSKHFDTRPIKSAIRSAKARRRYRRVLIQLARVAPCARACLVAGAVALAAMGSAEARGSRSTGASGASSLFGSYSRTYTVKTGTAATGERTVTYKDAVSATGKETRTRTVKTTINGVTRTEKETSSGTRAVTGYHAVTGAPCDPTKLCILN
jgi:hypothetical protein